MIDTNALLQIGFSLIVQFTNIVQVPPRGVSTNIADFERVTVASPTSATDLHLGHRSGTRFGIHDGTVYDFATPGSYRELQNPSLHPKFEGRAKMTANEVMDLANRTLARLTKTGLPITNLTPQIKIASTNVPFYWITWPPHDKHRSSSSAFVEVDARKGLITSMHLADASFFDLSFAQQISNRVYKPEAGPPRATRWQMRHQAPLKRALPYPATNDVAKSIASWTRLCASLGLAPGPETNLESVFWPLTFSYTNEDISRVAPVAQIAFSNGASFEAINGLAFSHFTADSMYTGFWFEMTREERDAFKGTIRFDWQKLAKDLEERLVREVGIPAQILAPFSPTPGNRPEPLGSTSIKRMVVDWRNWPRNAKREVLLQETKSAFEAEFDLETGELKWINFHDPNFIAALRIAQARSP